MATNTTPKPEPQHPPLARDAQGNLVSVPEGTAAWRICRQTTGRPKEIVGPDKRALRLPLETTPEELADLCGADVYRVYALDEMGKVLDYVAAVDVTRDTRELRNAAPDAMLLPALRTAAAPHTSDLRFALEAMAQMMRVNSEALRAVTESQAESLKTIASARGFFRNATPPIAVPNPMRDEEDDDDDDDDEPPPRKTLYDVLAPLAEHCAPALGPLVSMVAGAAGTKALGSGPTVAAAPESDLASKPNWELRDFVDLNYAASKKKAKDAAKQAGEGGGPKIAKPSLQARVMADPKLMAHFIAIKSLLEPEEALRIVAVGERITEQEQEWLIGQISVLSPERAAALLGATLAELGEAKASTTPTE
jgi:hypothetical protein